MSCHRGSRPAGALRGWRRPGRKPCGRSAPGGSTTADKTFSMSSGTQFMVVQNNGSHGKPIQLVWIQIPSTFPASSAIASFNSSYSSDQPPELDDGPRAALRGQHSIHLFTFAPSHIWSLGQSTNLLTFALAMCSSQGIAYTYSSLLWAMYSP